MAKMLLPILTNGVITATGPQPAVRCNVTPFAGGFRRNALLIIDHVIAGGGVISIDGSGLAGPTAPANGDASWAPIVVLNAASPLEQEIELPLWIRANITTVGTGTQTLTLEGIQ